MYTWNKLNAIDRVKNDPKISNSTDQEVWARGNHYIGMMVSRNFEIHLSGCGDGSIYPLGWYCALQHHKTMHASLYVLLSRHLSVLEQKLAQLTVCSFNDGRCGFSGDRWPCSC